LTDDDTGFLGANESSNGDGSIAILTGEVAKVSRVVAVVVDLLRRGRSGHLFFCVKRMVGADKEIERIGVDRDAEVAVVGTKESGRRRCSSSCEGK
jgi:hypothetical protein